MIVQTTANLERLELVKSFLWARLDPIQQEQTGCVAALNLPIDANKFVVVVFGADELRELHRRTTRLLKEIK